MKRRLPVSAIFALCLLFPQAYDPPQACGIAAGGAMPRESGGILTGDASREKGGIRAREEVEGLRSLDNGMAEQGALGKTLRTAARGDLQGGGAEGEMPSLYRASIRMLLALAFVMALLLASYWAFRRFVAGRGGIVPRGRFLKVLATGYLGPKKSISVVDIFGQVLILGVTSTEINLISRIEDPDVLAALKGGGDVGRGAASFHKYLERLWPGSGKGPEGGDAPAGEGTYDDKSRGGKGNWTDDAG